MTARSDQTNGRQQGINRKMIGAGLLAGAAIGAIATARARGLTLPQEPPDTLADWSRVVAIATSMNKADALTMPQRSDLDAAYRSLVEQCVPLVSKYMETKIDSPVERTFAFDRVDWIHANVEAFENLLAPLNDVLARPDAQHTVISALMGGLNRQIVSAEMGMLLGYLARRVLGQYDLALISGETTGPGNLYFVEPNIAATEHLLGLPKDEFRLWLALHETTHVFQFEGFPWVRPYFQSLLDEYFVFLKSDLGELRHGMQGVKRMVDRVRAGQGENRSWIESLMTPEQRVVFNRIQALMCIIEGYSNHVMNAVGRDLLSKYDDISRKFEKRQRNRSWGEQLLARITGLDMKLEQYRLGEEFVNAVVDARGHHAALQLWKGPENMPTMEELRAPAAWMNRVLGPQGRG
jgi:coenzyme F420 biosynthesis associated uncharacterized protein